jgi:chitinase
LPGKGTFYYNGWPTIKKKLSYALQKKAGGVMIWQLLGDAGGEYSLLKAIHGDIKN